ncbi:hypothetical protein GIB67_008094 [Kingdonia uniflora]|uniref:DCD domain-containing protein n=1 Tax=Kingdonia uniflora TaxID=39325 RepID=A0A7J7MCS0_9MAGN|nr:hypothetical protein GIB67_008094 [Kingdonia uniflora]
MMQGKKPQKQVVAYVEKSSISTSQNVSIIPVNFSPGKNFNFSNRNLRKEDLAGAIFGCKDDTMRECLGGQIFGLPSTHFQYVKNIEPGLPLFLLNYDDRKLYGIFEAASNGQININPYGWSGNGYEKTKFPAQVRVCPRKHCQPLSEKQFKPIIIANYHCSNRFWFELDHDQSAALISLFESSPANLAVAFPLYKVPQLKMNKKLNISLSENSMESVLSRMNNPIQNTCVDGHKSLENDFDKEEGRNEEQIPHAKLHKLASENETSNPSSISHSEDNFAPSKTNGMHVEDKCSLVINAASVTTQKYEVISASSSDLQPFVDKARNCRAEGRFTGAISKDNCVGKKTDSDLVLYPLSGLGIEFDLHWGHIAHLLLNPESRF